LVALPVSAVPGLPSSAHAAPLVCLVWAGHAALVPSLPTRRSSDLAAARQTVLEGLKASVGQALLVPSQVSAWSQTPAAARHTVPAGTFRSEGRRVGEASQVWAAPQAPAAARPTGPALPAGWVRVEVGPLQVSAVHGLPSSVHAAPLGCVASAVFAGRRRHQVSPRDWSPAVGPPTVLEGLKASVGQASLVPSQVSAWSQTPAAARHTVPAGTFASAGQAAPLPVQNSARSQAPAEARHWVVAGWKASAGQLLESPSQLSARSQGPAAARQTAVLLASAGQSTLEPVQVSVRSHAPAAARHTAPAFPAGCWQASLVPSHWSRVQGLPSEVHEVPAGAFASAGQVAPVPVHVSCASHSPADARHTTVGGWKPSAGQVVLVPVQLSAASPRPAEARQMVPALPAGCVHAGAPAVPLHTAGVPTLPW